MTKQEIIAKAEKRAQSVGGSYNPKTLAARVEKGLTVGDKYDDGSRRMTYLGGNMVRAEQRKNGEDWKVVKEANASQQQLDDLLAMIAAQVARNPIHQDPNF